MLKIVLPDSLLQPLQHKSLDDLQHTNRAPRLVYTHDVRFVRNKLVMSGHFSIDGQMRTVGICVTQPPTPYLYVVAPAWKTLRPTPLWAVKRVLPRQFYAMKTWMHKPPQYNIVPQWKKFQYVKVFNKLKRLVFLSRIERHINETAVKVDITYTLKEGVRHVSDATKAYNSHRSPECRRALYGANDRLAPYQSAVRVEVSTPYQLDKLRRALKGAVVALPSISYVDTCFSDVSATKTGWWAVTGEAAYGNFDDMGMYAFNSCITVPTLDSLTPKIQTQCVHDVSVSKAECSVCRTECERDAHPSLPSFTVDTEVAAEEAFEHEEGCQRGNVSYPANWHVDLPVPPPTCCTVTSRQGYGKFGSKAILVITCTIRSSCGRNRLNVALYVNPNVTVPDVDTVTGNISYVKIAVQTELEMLLLVDELCRRCGAAFWMGYNSNAYDNPMIAYRTAKLMIECGVSGCSLTHVCPHGHSTSDVIAGKCTLPVDPQGEAEVGCSELCRKHKKLRYTCAECKPPDEDTGFIAILPYGMGGRVNTRKLMAQGSSSLYLRVTKITKTSSATGKIASVSMPGVVGLAPIDVYDQVAMSTDTFKQMGTANLAAAAEYLLPKKKGEVTNKMSDVPYDRIHSLYFKLIESGGLRLLEYGMSDTSVTELIAHTLYTCSRMQIYAANCFQTIRETTSGGQMSKVRSAYHEKVASMNGSTGGFPTLVIVNDMNKKNESYRGALVFETAPGLHTKTMGATDKNDAHTIPPAFHRVVHNTYTSKPQPPDNIEAVSATVLQKSVFATLTRRFKHKLASLIVDFASLYPSIAISMNVCGSTMVTLRELMAIIRTNCPRLRVNMFVQPLPGSGYNEQLFDADGYVRTPDYTDRDAWAEIFRWVQKGVVPAPILQEIQRCDDPVPGLQGEKARAARKADIDLQDAEKPPTFFLRAPANSVNYGIIPRIMLECTETRKHYKKLKAEAERANDDLLAMVYDFAQGNAKVRVNSMYGTMPLTYNGTSAAAAVTLMGRLMASKAAEFCKTFPAQTNGACILPTHQTGKFGLTKDVLGGDTDSIFIPIGQTGWRALASVRHMAYPIDAPDHTIVECMRNVWTYADLFCDAWNARYAPQNKSDAQSTEVRKLDPELVSTDNHFPRKKMYLCETNVPKNSFVCFTVADKRNFMPNCTDTPPAPRHATRFGLYDELLKIYRCTSNIYSKRRGLQALRRNTAGFIRFAQMSIMLYLVRARVDDALTIAYYWLYCIYSDQIPLNAYMVPVKMKSQFTMDKYREQGITVALGQTRYFVKVSPMSKQIVGKKQIDRTVLVEQALRDGWSIDHETYAKQLLDIICKLFEGVKSDAEVRAHLNSPVKKATFASLLLRSRPITVQGTMHAFYKPSATNARCILCGAPTLNPMGSGGAGTALCMLCAKTDVQQQEVLLDLHRRQLQLDRDRFNCAKTCYECLNAGQVTDIEDCYSTLSIAGKCNSLACSVYQKRMSISHAEKRLHEARKKLSDVKPPHPFQLRAVAREVQTDIY